MEKRLRYDFKQFGLIELHTQKDNYERTTLRKGNNTIAQMEPCSEIFIDTFVFNEYAVSDIEKLVGSNKPHDATGVLTNVHEFANVSLDRTIMHVVAYQYYRPTI
jgi:hypothetical protein